MYSTRSPPPPDGAVTASYDPRLGQNQAGQHQPRDTTEIVLGAVNDSSNFLQAMQLANNGTNTVTSANPLGAVALNMPLAQANLSTAITAVDGSGNGSFTINGVSIAYNINTDSLATVMKRINASSAGVTASYNSATNNVVLTNNSTGDIGLGANDVATSGQVGLLGALGLTSASTLQHGQNALFTVNGGAAISSASNTLERNHPRHPRPDRHRGHRHDADGHGRAPTRLRWQTAIQNFVADYNTVQSYITQQTSYHDRMPTARSQPAILSQRPGPPELGLRPGIDDLRDRSRTLRHRQAARRSRPRLRFHGTS